MNNLTPNLDYLIFIPARDNSKRVPGKNLKLLNGKPLLQYTLDTAKGVKEYIENELGKSCLVVASVNSWELTELVSNYDFMIYARPQKLAQDHVQTDEVCLDVLRSIEMDGDWSTTHTIGILLQPTSPSRTMDDVVGCIRYADELDKYDAEMSYKTWCILTAQEADGFYWKSEKGYWDSEYNCINNDPRFRLGKQWIKDLNPLVKENGAVYVFPLRNLSLYRTYRMPSYFIYHTDPMIDVDTERDFALAEMIMREKNESD